jgi:hypothetical protein
MPASIPHHGQLPPAYFKVYRCGTGNRNLKGNLHLQLLWDMATIQRGRSARAETDVRDLWSAGSHTDGPRHALVEPERRTRTDDGGVELIRFTRPPSGLDGAETFVCREAGRGGKLVRSKTAGLVVGNLPGGLFPHVHPCAGIDSCFFSLSAKRAYSNPITNGGPKRKFRGFQYSHPTVQPA